MNELSNMKDRGVQRNFNVFILHISTKVLSFVRFLLMNENLLVNP
jgi:hypothetical protein